MNAKTWNIVLIIVVVVLAIRLLWQNRSSRIPVQTVKANDATQGAASGAIKGALQNLNLNTTSANTGIVPNFPQ